MHRPIVPPRSIAERKQHNFRAHCKENNTRGARFVLTGLDSLQDEGKGLLLGAVDYIIKPLHNTIVKLRVSTHLKIVEQVRTIEHLSMLGALTNIPNRRSFDNHLHVECRRSSRDKTPISILMIDIDMFKSFNDIYGHAHGDMGLKTVANVKQALIPYGDGRITKITVSIGVHSEIIDMAGLPADFIVKADQAPYAAKSAGRNIVKHT